MSQITTIPSGQIIYIDVCLPHKDYAEPKYLVVIRLFPPLLLKVNSKKEQTVIGKKQREFQFSLLKTKYPFFSHDISYLDCGTVWAFLISSDEILEQINSDPNRIKGMLIDDHKREALRLSKKSKSIEPKNRRAIEEEFNIKSSS